MQRIFGLAAAAALFLATAPAFGQSVLFDFEDGTDQGWGNKFAADTVNFPIVNIGGSNRMEVLRNGDFQEAEYNSGNLADPFLIAMNAATAAPSAYEISYDWYVDTSGGGYGNFLQLGTYINAGSGAYAQDFPGAGKDVELNGDQLASGQVFSGTITETLTQKYGAIAPGFLAQTFFRLGLIINGDGANARVYFDNIRVGPIIPEPGTLALLGLAAPALFALRRRSRG